MFSGFAPIADMRDGMPDFRLVPTTEVWGVLRLMTPTRRAGFWPLSDRVYRILR
jgi:hypothetical protein